MDLTAKTLWPLFPLLLLIVVVCLTWAFVAVVRRSTDRVAIWCQGAALVCYLLAAASAIASERGGMSANVHRPFSILTQVMIAFALYRLWGGKQRGIAKLNVIGWSAILADTALHYLLVR